MLKCNKCKGCRFFNEEIFFTTDGVELMGASCSITGKYSKSISGLRVVTANIQEHCPLNKISKYEKIRKDWNLLKEFVKNCYEEQSEINHKKEMGLLKVITKINELEKENDYEK